jgi:predicted enzyme related to lactoylglutathione lyase
MADKTVRGRFVWHELTTPDAGAAQAFYSKTLGWQTQAWELDSSYSMFVTASGPLGGNIQSADGAPGWLHYIGTPDIEATVQQATRNGATVKTGVTAIPSGGKYAILNDPQGAPFGVYWSAQEPAKEAPAKRGEFSWHELSTTDPRAALDFYGAVFGWEKLDEHDLGDLGKYVLFGRNGNQLGGIMTKLAEMPGGPAWLGYVRVKDVQQTAKKVKSAGGQVINGPMQVPGGDWIVQFVDAHGVMGAAHTVQADLPKSKPAATGSAQAAAAAPSEPEPAAAASAKTSAPAKKKAAKKATKKAAAKAARQPAAKKKAVKKKAATKKGGKKKAAKKKSAKKSAARGAKRPARKAAKKVARKAAKKAKRAGGKKKAARKARRGK